MWSPARPIIARTRGRPRRAAPTSRQFFTASQALGCPVGSGQPLHAKRLQDEKRHQSGAEIEEAGHDENGQPAASLQLQVTAQRHEQRGHPLGRVEERIVGGSVLAPEEVARCRREKGEDLSPREDRECREKNEQNRIVAEGYEREDRESICPER